LIWKTDHSQDIQQVQQGIPKKFDEIRGDIDYLYRDLSGDSRLGLRMDAAVERELAGIKDHKQRALFAQRVKDEEARRQLPAQVLVIASGVEFVASIFAPPLLPIATSLGAAATVAGAAEIPGSMSMHAAAQAGAGGKPLTHQTVEEARFNLTMAWADVAMAGLEVGLETKAIQRMATSAGRLAVGGWRLSRAQWTARLAAMRRGTAALKKWLSQFPPPKGKHLSQFLMGGQMVWLGMPLTPTNLCRHPARVGLLFLLKFVATKTQQMWLR
jgi:hypothetical protein